MIPTVEICKRFWKWWLGICFVAKQKQKRLHTKIKLNLYFVCWNTEKGNWVSKFEWNCLFETTSKHQSVLPNLWLWEMTARVYCITLQVDSIDRSQIYSSSSDTSARNNRLPSNNFKPYAHKHKKYLAKDLP